LTFNFIPLVLSLYLAHKIEGGRHIHTARNRFA